MHNPDMCVIALIVHKYTNTTILLSFLTKCIVVLRHIYDLANLWRDIIMIVLPHSFELLSVPYTIGG